MILIQNLKEMSGLGTKKVETSAGIPIWQRPPQNAQGGFGLDMAGLSEGVNIPAGTLTVYDEGTRFAKVIKSARAYEAVSVASTTVKVAKGNFYLKGDSFKSKTVSAIDTTNEAYDVFTLSEGVTVNKDEVVYSEAVTNKKTGLLYSGVEASTNEVVSVAIAGTVYARRIPPVESNSLPPTIILSNSF